MRYKAIIFDMDGLLLDSQRIATQTYIAAFDQLGLTADMPLYYRCIGTNIVATRQLLIDGLDSEFPIDAFMDIWAEKYITAAVDKPVPIKDGAIALLNYLKKHDIPCAVATSTDHHHATRKLANAGILHFFYHVVAGDQVSEGKPHPEIYQLAASRLNIATDRCLALEDSDNGVRAADAAGMTVIQIPDLLDPSEDILKIGHMIAGSLHDILTHIE